MRLEQIAGLWLLAMVRGLNALGRSVLARAAGPQSRRPSVDPTDVPDGGPSEGRSVGEIPAPGEARSGDAGPPEDWTRRTRRGPPAHWLALVRDRAPQLLDPAEDRDDPDAARRPTADADRRGPAEGLGHWPEEVPEESPAPRAFSQMSGDREPEAVDRRDAVEPRMRQGASKPVHGQQRVAIGPVCEAPI